MNYRWGSAAGDNGNIVLDYIHVGVRNGLNKFNDFSVLDLKYTYVII